MNKQTTIEKKREYDRNWKKEERKKDPEKVRAKQREKYRKMRENPEKLEKRKEYMRNYNKEWNKRHPERKQYRREWMKNWYHKNSKEIYKRRREKPYEKLAATIRSRIYDYLRNGYKSDKTEKLLGITMKELAVYLESKFKVGMTWENYGFYGWHVDHKKPLSSFDLTKEEEQKKAFHYTNLQPLWADENMAKGAKISN